MATKYVIKNMFYSKDMIQFINSDTTSLEDIWTTSWPIKREKNPDEYRPMIFETKVEANRYLKEVKRQARADWAENSHIHRMYGFRKPEWDIYTIEE